MTEEKKVTKKTAPKKATPKVTETVTEKVEPVKQAVKPKLTNDTEIEVMNNTTGNYGYVGRSGFAMDMTNYGDTLEIPFGELKRMRSEQPRHLTDAFIVVLDEDAIKELRLEKLYEGVVNNVGLDELFGNHEKLEKVLPKMPSTMKETVAILARRKFNSQELHDTRVKKVIENSLNIKIED